MSTFGTALLLRDKQAIFTAKTASRQWAKLLPEFLLLSLIGIALFGAVSADSPRWSVMWEHAWKVAIVYWGSMAICLPSLFVFSAVRGSRITVSELIFFVIAGLATIGLVLVSIAPITAFFAWTTNVPELMRLINVMAGGLASLFGIYLIGRGFAFIHTLRKSTDPESRSGVDFLLLWLFLLFVVMVQMIQTLKL